MDQRTAEVELSEQLNALARLIRLKDRPTITELIDNKNELVIDLDPFDFFDPEDVDELVQSVQHSEGFEIDDDDDQMTREITPVEPLATTAQAKEMAIQLERKQVDISDDPEFSALVRDVLRKARRMLTREEARNGFRTVIIQRIYYYTS